MKQTFLILFTFLSAVLHAQQLQSNIPVHDPVIIRQDSAYYIFCTGMGISMWMANQKLRIEKISWNNDWPFVQRHPE